MRARLRGALSLGLGGALTVLPAGCTPRRPVEAPRALEAPRVERGSKGEGLAPEGRRLVAAEVARAASQGAGPLAVVASDVASESDRVGGFVSLPKRECLLVYARGSEGVDDLDLFAYSDDGALVGADEATDPKPSLLLCPPLPGRAYVAARVASGRGFVALGAHLVPIESATGVARAFNVRSRREGNPTADAWPGLDVKVQALRRQLGGRWEERRRAAVMLDARAPTRLSAPLEPGECAAVLATPGEGVGPIELLVLDGEGRVVGRATERVRDRSVLVCSSAATSVTVEARPHGGAGIAAMTFLYSGEQGADLVTRPDRIDLYPAADVATGRVALAARLRAAGYGAPTATANGQAEVGRRASIPVALGAGCSRLDVVGGAPLAGVVAEAWSEAGALLARGEGGGGAALFVCAPAGRVRIEVEATARPGPFAIEARREAGAPAALGPGGVAAGRLLTRFNAGADVVAASQLVEIHALPLDATQRRTFEVRVPERRCLELDAAVGAGASGVELRLLEGAAPGVEIARGRGPYATAARACAGERARALTVEVRLGAGKGDAMVAGRVSEPPAR
ncbi:MAG: hypothetical protein MUF34_03760 [Polyangiaceae bacterium]|nr:hypothetical protein [Polyangiaceae bacterium]